MVETWKIVESVRKKTCCLHSSVVLNSAVHGVLMTGVCRRVPGSGLGVAEAAILRLLIRNSYLVFVPFQAQTSLCLKPWEPLTNPRHFPSDRSNEDVLTFMANPFQPHLSSGWELVARETNPRDYRVGTFNPAPDPQGGERDWRPNGAPVANDLMI